MKYNNTIKDPCTTFIAGGGSKNRSLGVVTNTCLLLFLNAKHIII